MRNVYITAVVYGWITVLFLILLFSALLSVIIRFTTITQFTLSYLSLTVGIIALLVGGIVAGIKGKEKGWVVGGLTGVGFTFLTFLIQYLGYNEMFSMQQLIYHAAYIISAIIGSIIGVNLATSSNTSSS